MPLPRDYTGQACSLARSLEVIGERWTLLIVRDAFFGVRRFGEFANHLGIPRAVLTDRLHSLQTAGVLRRVATEGARDEYELTEKGVSLWTVVHTLMAWGDEHYAAMPNRLFLHAADGQPIDSLGHCQGCGVAVAVQDIVVSPGPGLRTPADDADADADAVTVALTRPHRLLQPLRP